MKKIAKYKFTPIKKIYVGKIMIMNQKKKKKKVGTSSSTMENYKEKLTSFSTVFGSNTTKRM